MTDARTAHAGPVVACAIASSRIGHGGARPLRPRFEATTEGDQGFLALVLARVIEPTSMLDSPRVIEETGVDPPRGTPAQQAGWYASRRDWPELAKDLKPIYTAPSEQAALDAFADFCDKWENR